MSTPAPGAPFPPTSESRDAAKGSPTDSSRPHFPGLEGLRAIAAVMVVVHHSVNLSWHYPLGFPDAKLPILARYGHVMDGGVAVFFVLSGFLIYRPFVAAHLTGQRAMSAGRFFWRRFLRIVPAYWVALTFFWAIGQFHLGPPSVAWRYYAFGQIYSKDTTLGGIVPAWSLNTEITFYLMIPLYAALLGWVAHRWTARARVRVELAAVGLLIVSSYVVRAAISASDPSWRTLSFAWLPTNLDLFGAGMAVAVVSAWATESPAVRARVAQLGRSPELAAIVAFGLFTWFAFRVGPPDFASGYKGWYWEQRQLVLAVVALLLLIPAVFGDQSRGPLRWLLRWGPVHWVGLVSYGLYLWHLPWLDRLAPKDNGLGTLMWRGWIHGPIHVWQALGVGLGLGLTCAALSYYVLERPLQRFKNLV